MPLHQRLLYRVHLSTVSQFDPPQLAEIWRDEPPQRGVMQPVTPGLLEQLVFSKPYFDPEGLIVVCSDDKPIGFVHAGFGPNDDFTAISTDVGTTYQLMLRAERRSDALANELLKHSEAYLRGRGAKVIYAGGIRPLNGFYLGLYGGSELPGILVSDHTFNDACLRNGYREIDRVVILQLELAGFRPPVTRSMRQLRREVSLHEISSPPVRTWWDACTTARSSGFDFHWMAGQRAIRWLMFGFGMSSPCRCWNAPTSGMFGLAVLTDRRRKGLATFLLSESFERLHSRHIAIVEAQTMQQNAPAIALYEKLGFKKVDEGVVYRKEG